MRISLIAATGADRQLGKENKLLWHIPEDLKFFKTKTLNHPIVMGRKNFDSIGKALPKRENIVVTGNKEFSMENVTVIHDPMMVFDVGLELEEKAHANGSLSPDEDLEVFIIGGATLYEFFLPYATTLYLTEVNFEGEADVFFPMISSNEWVIDDISEWMESGEHQYRFLTLVREDAEENGDPSNTDE